MAQSKTPGKGHLVLLIEDDIVIREMYRTKFTQAGYKVLLAEDGQSGIDMLAKHAPELIMMDMMMPGLDGYETLTEIRKLENGKDTPVVILTNLGKEEAPDGINDLNPHSYIIKSDRTPTEIEQHVRAIITGKA